MATLSPGIVLTAGSPPKTVVLLNLHNPTVSRPPAGSGKALVHRISTAPWWWWLQELKTSPGTPVSCNIGCDGIKFAGSKSRPDLNICFQEVEGRTSNGYPFYESKLGQGDGSPALLFWKRPWDSELK